MQYGVNIYSPHTHQGLLVDHLRSIFKDVFENTRKTSTLKYETGSYMEFDVWIPSQNLCFEFQDSYHYVTTWYAHRSTEQIKRSDNEKRMKANQQGYSFVIVPCWWDGSRESLVASIQFQRPDIFIDSVGLSSSPITFNPPFNFFNSTMIPDVGELMLASFPIDAHFDNSFSGKTWWMGEKYDGIRCCWNPLQQKLGVKELQLKESMHQKLASTFLDCEIWFGRGQFLGTYVLVKGSSDLVLWQFLRVIGFDDPSLDIQRRPFEERYERIVSKISKHHPFCTVATRVECKNNKHLGQWVQSTIESAGEGVILRKFQSIYFHGRSHDLIKLKAAQGDQEAIVEAIDSDGVKLRLPNGPTFRVPWQDVRLGDDQKPTEREREGKIEKETERERERDRTERDNLCVGSVVSVTSERQSRRHQPVHPILFRVRHDLEWSHVISSSSSSSSSSSPSSLDQLGLNDKSQVVDFTSYPQGHWNEKNARLFLENFAQQRGLNPLLAETWYQIPGSSVRNEKGGSALVSKFGGYFKTLLALFPDIGLDAFSFLRYPWRDITLRRKAFEKYASERGFDPQVPSNWYSTNVREGLANVKGIRSILWYHSRSVAKALLDLFPNIGLDPAKFPKISPWKKVQERRKFFIEYARENNFDPRIPSNWYSQTSEKIHKKKGAREVMSFHNRSIARALVELFPDIGLVLSKFNLISPYRSVQARRNFFERIAEGQQFDPLVATNWYKIPLSKITSTKGAKRVLSYHGGQVVQALVDLFPDINFQQDQFFFHAQWREAKNRRVFFEEFARDHKFDPLVLTNWYSFPLSEFLSTPGAIDVIEHHGGSVAMALSQLFPNIGLNNSLFELLSPWSDKTKRRNFFENYAESRSFDPLVPEHWYSQSLSEILSEKGVKGIIAHHSGDLVTALIELFDDIGLKRSLFLSHYRYQDAGNRRNFFKMFAKEHNFDPSVPDNWYLHFGHVMLHKDAHRVVAHHKGSVSKSLMDLLPAIGFKHYMFLAKSPYKEVKDRRDFFVKYAQSQGFDPFVPENWYTCSISDLSSAKGANYVIDFHDYNIFKAIVELFPDVPLDVNVFIGQYSDKQNRKQFFYRFAESHKFDYSVPENWYSKTNAIIDSPGSNAVLSYYKGSVSKALCDLFPELNFDKHKFQHVNYIWKDKERRRSFFEDFAKVKGFDPLNPHNWYSQPRTSISSLKGARTVLEYHNNNIPQALVELFPEMEFDLSKFNSDKPWQEKENRRKLFEKYANTYSFDALDPEKWYHQPISRILSFKGVSGIMAYYKYNIPKALMDNFPEIELSIAKFRLK